MGERKNKLERFIQEHPKCIFCGGNKVATTIEHCPPRALFQERKAPEGFEFPACFNCNNNTSDDDLIVAVIMRMGSPDLGNSDGKLIGMMKNLKRQKPHFYKHLLPTAIEARKNNRQHGITPKVGMTHQDMGIVNISDEIKSAIKVFAKKIAKGILYLESGVIFKNTGCLVLNWFTNANILKDKGYKLFDLLSHIDGKSPKVLRATKVLNEQFEYKFSISDDKNLFLVQIMFGKSFGLVVIGCKKQGFLENLLARIYADLEADFQPFEII